MDTVNNIYSIRICEWLFKIISKHGVKYQFVSTPGVGCQYGTTTSTTKTQTTHMCGIQRPSQGVQHPQTCLEMYIGTEKSPQ